MSRKVSVKAATRDALREDARARQDLSQAGLAGMTGDSFANFQQKLGIGADNILTTSTYTFNPITRNRALLEWIHRGSWIGGVAVDVVADDMSREGIEYVTELPPDEEEVLSEQFQALNIWDHVGDTVRWARLYGGCICVLLIDGQDLRTPLRLETVGPEMFKGLLVLDRWMVDPALEDLVTEYGPSLGHPKYYRIGANAPALRGNVVHYSRLAFRLEGVKLPYQQRLTENLWGLSVLERMYDRMIAYDLASTGAAQLVNKAHLRTFSIEGFRDIVAGSPQAMRGMAAYADTVRRFQGIEGITMIDAKDTFEAQVHGAFSGLADILGEFGQQIAGALQIPLTRLLGQSPKGFSDGDNDIRNYYDHIKQRQERDLHQGILRVLRCVAQSNEIILPDNFQIKFRSLWQLNDIDKASISKSDTDTVLAAHEAALISPQTALKELRQSSRKTGLWTNITSDLIEEADVELPPTPSEMMEQEAALNPEPEPGASGAPGATKPSGGSDVDGNKAGSQAAEGPLGKGQAGGGSLSRKAKVSG